MTIASYMIFTDYTILTLILRCAKAHGRLQCLRGRRALRRHCGPRAANPRMRRAEGVAPYAVIAAPEPQSRDAAITFIYLLFMCFVLCYSGDI